MMFDLDKIFAGLGKAVKTYDGVLERLGFPEGTYVDEIAYMTADHETANIFLREAVMTDGCVHFNSATDHVHTEPLMTHYNVLYDFLTVPLPYLNGHEVRIEAMHLIDGFSPLHEAERHNMRRDSGILSGIHASFRCPDEEQYGAALHRLRMRGWEAAQRCSSTYGRFSYWKPTDPDTWVGDGPHLYLKPRVNLRDAS